MHTLNLCKCIFNSVQIAVHLCSNRLYHRSRFLSLYVVTSIHVTRNLDFMINFVIVQQTTDRKKHIGNIENEKKK